MRHLIVFIALCGVLSTEESLNFKPPEGTKPAIIDQAAKTLEARCKLYGYADIKFISNDDSISVSCATGLTTPMQKAIRTLACIQGKSIMLHVHRKLTNAEEEQYAHPFGNQLMDSHDWDVVLGCEAVAFRNLTPKTPKGSRWVSHNPDFDAKHSGWTLVNESSEVPFNRLKPTKYGKHNVAVSDLRRLIGKDAEYVQFSIVSDDNISLSGAETIYRTAIDKAPTKELEIYIPNVSKYLAPIVANPLPFPLRYDVPELKK